MIKYFFEFLIGTFAYILADLVEFFTAPLNLLLRSIIPNFDSYFTTANNFIVNYLLKGFQWVKMSFIHIANINDSVFDLFIISLGLLLSLYGLILAFKLGYNAWSIFHGSQSKN